MDNPMVKAENFNATPSADPGAAFRMGGEILRLHRDGSRPYYRDPKTGATRSVRRYAIRARRKMFAARVNWNAPVRVLLDESEHYEKPAR